MGFYVPCNSSSKGQYDIVERVALYLEFLIFILFVTALGNAYFLQVSYFYKMGR